MPIATYSPINVRDRTAETTGESLKNPTLKAAAATTAAETNHFSCRRSSRVSRTQALTRSIR
jgi:hypothetical protein